MTLKTNQNDPDNRGRDVLKNELERLNSIWLDGEVDKITLSDANQQCNVEEIRRLIDNDDKDGSKPLC